MSDPNQYTVGWICALETEYVAARAFLEKKHPRPETLSPNDNNHYTLGEIAGHRVVIAGLPDGEYGISSAAGVARDMVHSFPNIRFGLMVGIGGGVPTKHDIRLGDVIVSSSRNGRGGLLQYDLGKELQGQKFYHTGFLNQPPPILRTAVAGLQAQYEKEDHQLKASIQAVLEGNKRLKRKYTQPPFEADRLFESQFAHPNSQENCGEICDSSKLIYRPKRTDEEDDPAIHYGLIASGNRVIKDAIFRDKLAVEEDILCFEIEAAGLMNHFSCLVIRGVCDYADSHKSKEWQGWAAMMAAAYARDLLYQIIPQRLKAERKASEILDGIKSQLANVSEDIHNLHSITSRSAQEIHALAESIDLKELPVAAEAEFGTYMDQHEEECLPGTRKELLLDIQDWTASDQGKCIFWLNSLAGTGKSTISRTIAKAFQKQGLLGASFFFKRGEGDRGNAARFFPTIIQQLFTRIPEVRAAILQAIRDNPRISAKPLKEQFEELIHKPLHSLNQSKLQSSRLVIVVDALDECDHDNDIQVILQLMPRVQEVNSLCLRFFITSRPELPIRLGFTTIDHRDLVLHEVPKPIIERDIFMFLDDKLVLIRHKRSLSSDWPGYVNVQILVTMSVPLFIFAATICRLLEDYNLDPEQCLTEILKYQNQESKLDGTYLPVLDRLASKYSGARQKQLVQEVREVVGTIILLESPLSVTSLSKLMGISTQSIHARLNSLHSVLYIPNNDMLPVRLFHQSFRDFLLDLSTRDKTPFWIDEKGMNQMLFTLCLSVMRKYLKKNICSLESYGTKRSDINPESIDHYLLPELQYSCRFWTHHLARSKDPISQVNDILAFLKEHFLHWLESMSILGMISEAIIAVDSLLQLTKDKSSSEIHVFLLDARKFILKFAQIVDSAPLQLYISSLIFAPHTALIRDNFERELPAWLSRGPRVEEYWDPEMQTLEGHSDSVSSVAFSGDGQLLASGSYDETIKLWDAATGALKHTLE
ncbi:purine and uridine phosphorylase, partial [Aspergillus niger CBS 101883]|uniref:purine and uridine phosphorylase n=1 Tax=Aspergillus lacticoffeatus (strain CBS 101883) TaxID=1450533 RepID=UPI000D8007BB